MDHQNGQVHHQMQANYYGPNGLPDTTSSEKALMWSSSQSYMCESGYNTQAPSISSIDAFLNNEQMDSTLHNMDSSSIAVNPNVQEFNQIPAQPQQQQQPQPQTADDGESAVANWMNYQDSSEMALKAIPELLKLLIDDDMVVVQQASQLLFYMGKNDGPTMALIKYGNAVDCIVDCLLKTADLETAKNLIGTLYSISTKKPTGVEAIINSRALPPLVKMISAPLENIVSYAVTSLHNILVYCDDTVKSKLRSLGVIHLMIPLLQNYQNGKFLSVLVDCMQILAFGNQETKQLILELGGTQMLVGLLMNPNPYPKFLLNAARLLKVLSTCSKNKPALVNFNAMQALSQHLLANSPLNKTSSSNTKIYEDILHNSLLALRNLSDLAIKLDGLESLIQQLVQVLAGSNNITINTVAAHILSNLTCSHENNKRAAFKSNAIPILLKTIQANIQNPAYIDPCICSLRHLMNKYTDVQLAQEQLRNMNGLTLMGQILCSQPRTWSCVKAIIGLIRNLASNQVNISHLRSNSMIEKLMQTLFEATQLINMKTNNGLNVTTNSSGNVVVKQDDVNLFDIVDLCSSCIWFLSKEYQSQIMMRDLECIGFFVEMFASPLLLYQRWASTILAELATSKECATVIDQHPSVHHIIQANYCNQFGNIKSVAEFAGNIQNNSVHSAILQNVTSLVKRLQEYKAQQRNFMMQQHRGSFNGQYPSSGQMMQQDAFGMQMNGNGLIQQSNLMYYNNAPAMYNQMPPVQPSSQQFSNNMPQFY